MSNFTLQDAAGSLVAVAVFALVLYVPGYVLGYAANLADFRKRSAGEQTQWAVAHSFAVTPIACYLVGKYAGLNAACGVLLALAAVWLVLAWRERRAFRWTSGTTLTAAVAVAWMALVIVSLVDIQVSHKLYFSVVLDDQSYRVAFTDAVLRTGVPPANPLYFAGHAQPMRYYYFWYVVCAMVARIGHVTARHAFIASSVWTGFGMAAMLGLFVRHFLGVVEDAHGVVEHAHGVVKDARRQVWLTETRITIALLAVTGADLLPAIGSLFAQPALNGDMEWWSVDQISSWMDSLLWVPHHVASLLCCMVAFLLLWMTRGDAQDEGRDGADQSGRSGAVAFAAVAFASSFGLSVYVAFGFALLMLAWMARLLVARPRDRRLAARVALVGMLGGLMLVPYLKELGGADSASIPSAHTSAGHVFAFSIRRMIDPGFLTRLPALASWNSAHPWLLDQAARLVLLLPGIGLELGFYGAVLWLYCKRRRDYTADGPQRTALYLAGWGLAVILFVRSAVIDNNDFGYRAALLPQFFLLLLAADLLGSWWIVGRTAVVVQTQWRRKALLGLLALGIAGTVYQVVMLRIFLPLEASRPASEFAWLPGQVYAARAGFAELDRVARRSAVVEFNPTDAHPLDRGDVMSPYTFYTRAMQMYSGRQILSAEPECPVQFGGDSISCAAIESATRRLYSEPAPTAEWARVYCRRFGVDDLVVSAMDPVGSDPLGWARTLPRVVSEPDFRIVRCSDL